MLCFNAGESGPKGGTSSQKRGRGRPPKAAGEPVTRSACSTVGRPRKIASKSFSVMSEPIDLSVEAEFC